MASNIVERSQAEDAIGRARKNMEYARMYNRGIDLKDAPRTLGEAEDMFRRLPDRPGINYVLVLGRARDANRMTNDIVFEHLSEKLKVNIKKHLPNFPKEFGKAMVRTAERVKEKSGAGEARRVLLGFNGAVNKVTEEGPTQLCELCRAFGITIPERLREMEMRAKAEKMRERYRQTQAQLAATAPQDNRDLLIFRPDPTRPRSRRRQVVEVDQEIKSLDSGGAVRRYEDSCDDAPTLRVAPDVVELRMEFGQNPKSLKPQWEVRKSGTLYVLDQTSPEPPGEHVDALYEVVKVLANGLTFVKLVSLKSESRVLMHHRR